MPFKGFPCDSAGKESACSLRDLGSIPRSGKSAGEGRARLPTPVFLGFPCDSAGKESTCNVGDLGLITGLGRSPGEGKGYPLWYSGLGNSMDCVVRGVTKSWTRLSDFHFTSLNYSILRETQAKSLGSRTRQLFHCAEKHDA